MEKLDALYKMAVIRDDAKAIEEIAVWHWRQDLQA